MTAPASRFALNIDRVEGYEFRVRFDKPELSDLTIDEGPPLGKERGPNPARVLAAAIGSCLSASLVFCLGKSRVGVEGMHTKVEVELVRNEARRLRIGRIDVTLHPEIRDGGQALAQCLEGFEDFCVVTQSVRQGVEVGVRVEPAIDPQDRELPASEADRSLPGAINSRGGDIR